MVQVFNPQALNDPGFGAAASLLGNNIGTFAGMLNQKSQNKNALLQALLGQVGGAGREFLQNRMEGDQGRNALNAALGEELPNDMRISPASANTIIQAVSTPAQLRALNLISGISKDQAAANIPGSDLGFNAVSQGLSRIIGGQGQPTGSSATGGQGGGILGKYLGSGQPVAQPQVSPEPTSTESIPVQSENGTFSLGVSQVQKPEPVQDQNLIAKKARADTIKAELDAREKGVTATPSDPNYLYGSGNTDAQQLSSQLSKGQAPDAIDLAGQPIGIPMNRRLVSSRMRFARLSPDKQADIGTSVDNAASTVDNYLTMRDKVLDYQRKGQIGRLRTKIATSGLMEVLLPDNPSEADMAVKQFADARNALAVKLAIATGQAANSISNKDAASFQAIQGNPNGSQELFLRQSNNLLASFLVPGVENAANVDASQFQRLRTIYNNLAGQDYDWSATMPVTEASKLFDERYKKATQSKLKESLRSPISQPKTIKTPTRSTSGGNLLEDIDAVLKQQGAL